MTKSQSIRSLAGALAVASVVVFGLQTCGKGNSPTPASRGAPTGVYTVRARVEMVPVPGKPTTEFMVYHEPIDAVVNPDGSRGMNSMTMPIPLAQGVSIEGIHAGDLVVIELAMWTNPGNLWLEARSVKKLPPDTQLHFGKAAPPLVPAKEN